MTDQMPTSVLFCCDYNSVRSPMAEGIMKKLFGTRIYVQSAGVKHELEIDGFSVAACAEIGVELTKHRTRSFEEMEEWGDQIGGYDLIVALSPASLQCHRCGILADLRSDRIGRDAGGEADRLPAGP